MHQELKARNQIPYGGQWTWTDPITGVKVQGTNWDMLLTFIRKERQANGVPMGLDFEKELEQDLCKSKPDECIFVDPGIPRNRRLSFADVVRGTKVLLAFKLAGSPLVAPEEAKRRAAICQNCRFNIQFDKPCAGACGELNEIVKKIIGGTGTVHDTDKSCGICSCYSAAHVQIPYEILETGLTDDMKRQFAAIDWCWKRPQT